MKDLVKTDLFEFRFRYHYEDSVGRFVKYFLAHDFKEANEMFVYACGKREDNPLIDRVDKWNRWADRWETLNISSAEPSLN